MAELITKQLQNLQFNSEVATAADVSSFVNTTATELSTSLIERIQALEGFSTFIGVKDSLPESAENGQIVIVGEKEYIWGPKADGVAGWTELGDTTAEAAAIDELSGAVASLETDVGDHSFKLNALEGVLTDLETTVNSHTGHIDEANGRIDIVISELTTKADVSSVNASVEALTSAIEAVEASLSGYDTVGSAAAALLSAKAYTDEQIAAVEGEISSLTDVVETKADQTAVDAAISAINENISTLSAKAEEDPEFQYWKDYSTIIALGFGAVANAEYSNAIGNNANATGLAANAIGNGANAEGARANAIGNNAMAYADNSNAIGNGANATGLAANAIGNGAEAYLDHSNAIGYNAKAYAKGAIQIGEGVNEATNSFQFMSTQIVDGNGKITTANLAGIDTLKTALNSVAEVTASDDVAKLRATVNALAAAIKAFAGL